MRKIFTVIVSLLSVAIGVNAKTVFVAASGNNTTGNSWTNALTSIPNSGSAAIAAGDSVFVKGGVTGTYSFSASVSGNSAFATKADVNYLGGFAGSESNSAQRPLSDLDVNGIIEPWEFSNATTLSFNSTNNAYGLYITTNSTTQRVFDGFKITGSFDSGALTGSINANNMIRINGYTSFQNNTISGCTLAANPNTSTPNMGYTKGLLVLVGSGSSTTVFNQVNNCLIENNTSTVTAGSTQIDTQQSPFIHLDASSGSGRNLFSNNIIRKNQIAVNFSATALTTNYNTRGVLFSMSIQGSGSHTAWNAFKNNVVYNNDATYISPSPTGAHSLGNGGLIFPYNTNYASIDSVLNNTIANNKMTKIGTAIKIGINTTTTTSLQNKTPYHKVLNNTLYNNTNYNGSTTSAANIAVTSNPDNTTAGILIANNYSTAGGLTNTTGTNPNIVNNVVDLSTTNTDATKGARFTAPTANTLIGYSTDPSVATSRWTIGSSSYLISKGLATNSKYDKANMLFASTPSVGAYEGGDVVIPSSGNHSISSTTALKSLTVNAGGKLTLNNGVTFTVGALELQSNNDNGTATFVNKGGTLVSSSSKVQQYLTNQSWYLSSPVQGTVTPTNLTRIQGYNEGVGTGTDWSVSGTTMTAKKGYIISVNAAPNTVEFTGTINSGAVSVPLTRQAATDANKYGFNLIGNPYTAYLDWRAVATANASKMPTSTMWYRTKTSGSWAFTTVNGSGVASPANVSYLIPPMQAFWVRASTVGNSNLELTNDMVFHDNNSGNKLKAPAVSNTERQMLRLQVSNAINTDELVIYTDAQALNSFDNFDSPKMSNESADIPEISSVVDDQSLVINGLNSLTLDSPIPLRFMTKTANTFTFKANQVSNLPEGVKVILNDNGTEFDLTNGAEYNFTSNISDNTSRFSLLFRAPGVTTGIDNASKLNTQVFVNAANQITIIAPEKSNYSIYNAVGQLIENGNVKSKLQTANYKLQTGIYVVKVNNQSTKVIIK